MISDDNDADDAEGTIMMSKLCFSLMVIIRGMLVNACVKATSQEQ